jgi:hypothetical protein
MREAGETDAALQKILDDAHLGYLPQREGGWMIPSRPKPRGRLTSPRYTGQSPATIRGIADLPTPIHNGFDGVRLEQVPIVAPSLYPMGGDELIESLSFCNTNRRGHGAGWQ